METQRGQEYLNSLEYLQAIEERDTDRDPETELVLAYVPESDEMWFPAALSLANRRSAEAAETLRLDCIQIATL